MMFAVVGVAAAEERKWEPVDRYSMAEEPDESLPEPNDEPAFVAAPLDIRLVDRSPFWLSLGELAVVLVNTSRRWLLEVWPEEQHIVRRSLKTLLYWQSTQANERFTLTRSNECWNSLLDDQWLAGGRKRRRLFPAWSSCDLRLIDSITYRTMIGGGVGGQRGTWRQMIGGWDCPGACTSGEKVGNHLLPSNSNEFNLEWWSVRVAVVLVVVTIGPWCFAYRLPPDCLLCKWLEDWNDRLADLEHCSLRRDR